MRVIVGGAFKMTASCELLGSKDAHSHQHGATNRLNSFRPSEADLDKLRSTLKQLVRDWSIEVYISFYPLFPCHWILIFFLFKGKVGARCLLWAHEGSSSRSFQGCQARRPVILKTIQPTITSSLSSGHN